MIIICSRPCCINSLSEMISNAPPQAVQERNYHIFYCMLAGITAEQRKALKLGNTDEYKFLTQVLQWLSAAHHWQHPVQTVNDLTCSLHVLQGDCVLCEGRDDAKDYSRICSAMKILTFSENQCQEILKLLAAMLHLGNVSFEGEHVLLFMCII